MGKIEPLGVHKHGLAGAVPQAHLHCGHSNVEPIGLLLNFLYPSYFLRRQDLL